MRSFIRSKVPRVHPAAALGRRVAAAFVLVTASCASQTASVSTPVVSSRPFSRPPPSAPAIFAPVPAPTVVLKEIESTLPAGPPRQAPPSASWSLIHQRFVGIELALGPDGSIYVAGGDANRRTVGGRPVLWLAKLSAGGEQLWGKTLAVPMVRLPGGLHPRESIDLTLAVTGSGGVTAIGPRRVGNPYCGSRGCPQKGSSSGAKCCARR